MLKGRLNLCSAELKWVVAVDVLCITSRAPSPALPALQFKPDVGLAASYRVFEQRLRRASSVALLLFVSLQWTAIPTAVLLLCESILLGLSEMVES
jgi:hypothetical protein